MGSGVSVVYDRDGLTVARFDRVLITLVNGPITLAYLDAAHDAGRTMKGLHAGGIASLTIIPGSVPIPDDVARQRASKYTKEADTWVCAGATVVGAAGFTGSVMRSVLVAMTLFQGGPPRRVFSAADAAVAWLAPHVGMALATQRPLLDWCATATGAAAVSAAAR